MRRITFHAGNPRACPASVWAEFEKRFAVRIFEGYAAVDGAPRHVVLSHPPPHGCRVDRTHLMRHVGSRALRAFVERHQPAPAHAAGGNRPPPVPMASGKLKQAV